LAAKPVEGVPSPKSGSSQAMNLGTDDDILALERVVGAPGCCR